jgi:hydrogenase maturation protein HypF
MGRLFDAAAAILGVRNRGTFEGQAAMELESLAGARTAHAIEMPASEDGGMLRIDPLPVLVALGERAARGDDVRDLAAVFHESVIAVVVQAAGTVAASAGISTVALGGGSFQNARLLAGVRAALEFTGLRVIAPVDLPPNDGGISYGQAAVAAALTA